MGFPKREDGPDWEERMKEGGGTREGQCEELGWS